MDRLSRASLKLAEITAANGGIVFFEPSSISDPKYFHEAINIAHIVKYASQRVTRSDEGICNKSKSVLLEICTHGENGLEWKYNKDGKWGKWHHMKAFSAHNIADTCGSGDWCTAGIISKICHQGTTYLKDLLQTDLVQAFKYSQILAAWNCRFEGARGGMYSVSKKNFIKTINEFFSKGPEVSTLPAKKYTLESQVNFICPSCGAPS
jgi:fructokinase